MRSSALFGIYSLVIVSLVVGMAVLTLYSLEKSRWWDARTQLAQESHALHLKLEANLYRLFKQHGDVLLIGDRDGGAAVTELRAKIDRNLDDIRNVIAREIQMVGDEEIEELELLDEIENDIRSVNAVIATLTTSGEPIETFIQIERLAGLLDGDIDDELDRKINAALEEEIEEVEEVLEEAAAFRNWNTRLVYVILLVAAVTFFVALLSFSSQIRQPIIRLQNGVNRLRDADYSEPVYLGGSREFKDLGTVLNQMAEQLKERELSRVEQQKHLEETVAARTSELQELVDKLEIGEENRKQLMADISHELRTPLAIILGEADVTLRTAGTLSDDVSDAFARIRESAKHTNQIVDDMLTVARYEAGQLRLDRKEIDLNKVVKDAVSMFPGKVNVSTSKVAMKTQVDEVRLRQAVLALLQNARRYGGPKISVDLSETARAYVIAIEDDGPGLSANEKSQAFERFFRGSNAAGQGVEGSGLGLPVVKSIVEAHKGTVVLLDREDTGLRVVIELPKELRGT
ncbi:HAMP domain-containing histidine kinase [Octadecabacter sp. G9-8]|uniref:histidine kinase n=1 Tax=Octadecabacter dasysiphoniae TaxID=2909341 RepID=A0ABS9CTT6_9RHOB|nr:HAMP domain-containing sensor histidine kinase [Octadecabacter dasysiphoniae]MCF2870649.1 HAMP domain-containing histidine kinase [Octadecabacter dasysiphoniae]